MIDANRFNQLAVLFVTTLALDRSRSWVVRELVLLGDLALTRKEKQREAERNE